MNFERSISTVAPDSPVPFRQSRRRMVARMSVPSPSGVRRAEQQRQRRPVAREDGVAPTPIGSAAARATIVNEDRRARRAEQQRQRRARARQSQAVETTVSAPATAIAQATTSAHEDRRTRRAEQQRRRRAIVRESESSAERTARVAGDSEQRTLRRVAESTDVQASRRLRRRAIDQVRDASRRAQDVAAMDTLSDRILGMKSLTSDEITWMSKGQRFTQDPTLALAYYYCCGANPGSFVFGNEEVCGATSQPTTKRLGGLLNDYPKKEDLALCQNDVATTSAERTDVWACASCGRVLLDQEEGAVRFRGLDELKQDLQLGDAEKAKLMEGVTADFVRKYRQVFFDGDEIYFLIPDLVRDRDKIPLCEKCNAGPRANKFSVASGHDYGRVDQLPDLSDIARACITPTRCFGLELSLSTSTGHAIAFPSNGPCELARVLPSLDQDCMPRVTFIGPLEDWRLEAKKFRHLYAIEVASVYEWLGVLSQINTVFLDESIVVDCSDERQQQLKEMEAAIEATIHISQSQTVSTVFEQASSDQCDSKEDGEATVIHSSFVLPAGDQASGRTTHEIVEALIDTLGGHPEKPTRETEASQSSPRQPVIPVKRGRSPFVEWLDNAKIIAGVFPDLFLTGDAMLPSGPMPRDFIDHFMHYWDGRFEKSVMFAAMLFNQLQRHSAIQKAARVGISHGRAMTKFGKLASTPAFRSALQTAKANPESPDAVRMNAALLRLLALVGGCVPFSPFERAATRPKLGAMRYRYGIAQHFVTIAPPEHDDLLLHRIAELRQAKQWNDCTHPCSRKECRFENLRETIRSNSAARQAVARRYPALSAQVFERQMATLTRDILRCQETSASRVSRNYLEHRCGVYGRVAAFNAVIEPQSKGRLHAHLTIYGSSINPDILTRLAGSIELWPSARKWLNAVSATQISPQTRQWCEKWEADHEMKRARAFEIEVPDASIDYDRFLLAAEKRALVTNVHSHSHTCHKGLRGRFVCRLARPAGVHGDITKPLHIRLIQASNLGKRRRAEFQVNDIQNCLVSELNPPRDYANKRVLSAHTEGAVVWEQTRPQTDAMFVETNLALACLSGAHTNSAVINGKDAGDMVEEYQQSYMTKERGGLKCGTTVMLTALDDIDKYPSVADDRGTYLRCAKHLATRTVNAFTGGTEWPHALMVYALAGHRSFQSSDTFWFVFPHKLVEEMNSNILPVDDDEDDDGSDCQSTVWSESEDETGSMDVNQRLESIAAIADDDRTGQPSRGSTYSSGGARMFKVDDTVVLVTQAQSYRHRGEWFHQYTALEFEVIVDILPRSDDPAPEVASRGRPKRRGFDLSSRHPLAPHFQGFIRTKFKTAMLGGPPPPTVPKNGKPSAALSKYILCLMYPWCSSDGLLPFRPTPSNLIRVCSDWDSTEASFIDAQRYRVIHNVLQKHYRSSKNEKVCSEWRSRNAEMWNDTTSPAPLPSDQQAPPHCDPEMAGLFSAEDRELFSLTKAAAAKSQRSIDAIRDLRATFWAPIPTLDGISVRKNSIASAVFRDHIKSNIQLSKVARSIHTMAPPTSTTERGTDSEIRNHACDSNYPLQTHTVDRSCQTQYSPDQQRVFDAVVGRIEGRGKLGQTLTVVHGGGGTGKSTLIRHITSTLSDHGICTVSTCPTGVGASHLKSGKTIHSAFKTLRKTELGPNDLELMRLTFTQDVWLIVVDEMSMLSAENLVLIDSRLRAIYKNNVMFGGRSLMLAGDFLQIDVTAGTPLCKMMYDAKTSPNLATARALFHEFKVFFLTQQHRAAGCQLQKANLQACRSLPSFYPSGSSYTTEEMREFRPITRVIAQAIAKEITMNDIQRDTDWLDEMTILVTNNTDKAALTPCAVHVYAIRHDEIVFRWRRRTKIELPAELQRLIYDEDAHPELFAYFVAGVRAQILDNNNGNVGWCVANGSPCKMHSLAWEDRTKNDLVFGMIQEAQRSGTRRIDLPFPPDFINVQLLDSNGKAKCGSSWPLHNNLDPEWVLSPEGKRLYKKTVVIPIGLISSKSRKKCIHLGREILDEVIDIEYIQHAVDVALVMTVWKAQGSTIKRIILNLEPTGRPKWGFEHIYVGLSRVTEAKFLRCLPLTGAFRFSSLQSLRPSVSTTKWRLDNRPQA